MLDFLLAPIVELYRYALQPMAPFTWFGLPFSLLDVAAAVRTCVALRQIKEQLRKDHVVKKASTQSVSLQEVQERSFVRDVTATLLVVFGGEAMTGTLFLRMLPMHGYLPSFDDGSSRLGHTRVFHGVWFWNRPLGRRSGCHRLAPCSAYAFLRN